MSNSSSCFHGDSRGVQGITPEGLAGRAPALIHRNGLIPSGYSAQTRQLERRDAGPLRPQSWTRVRRSAAPGRLDGRDVDLLHRHHGFKGTSGLLAPRGQ